MAKSDSIEVEGVVMESLPGTKFKVKLQNGSIILCTICGKLRINNINIIDGDNVTVEMSPYDLTKGRITWRTK